jgi:ABC-type multidrug transport system fused ATPase/permease subunit
MTIENSKKTKDQNPVYFLSKMMWRYSATRRAKVVLYVVMSIIAAIIWALEPLVVGFMLNSIQEGGITEATMWGAFLLLLGLIAIEVGGWTFHGISRYIEMNNAFFARSAYKQYLLAGTLALPIEWQSDHHSGDTIDKIEKGTNGLFGFSENTFQIIQVVVTLIAGIAALMYFDIVATLAVLAFTVPTFFVLARFDKRLVAGYKKVSLMENETTAKVFDALSNVTTVIILRVEALVARAIETAIQKPRPQYSSNARVNEWKWFTASILGRLASVAVVAVYLLNQLRIGTIMVGTIYILYGYVDKIRGTLFQFASLYNDIIRWRANIANTEALSDDFRERLQEGKDRLPSGWQTLSIRDLSFSYENGSDTLHLSDVTLDIKKGERVALIGESGGGKSTFLKLLRDLYHPKTLSLSVDGKEIPDGFVGISDSISLVPQDPEIFSTTIRENITLGVSYPETHIGVYTDVAQFSDIVKRLPKGLESSIVEKGVNLSGGEKQRLALARGLLASEHKDIVLLDEPTSSVDFGNELKIYQNIFDAFPGKTIISSIHRLHLLSQFDSVYLLKGGRIIARGSFEVLKKESPDFRTLWDEYIKTRDAELG